MACRDGLLLLTVLEPWRNRGEAMTYVLLHGTEKPPAPHPDTLWLRSNPKSLAVLVGAQLGYLAELNALDRVSAVSRRAYVYAPGLRQAIDSGQIAEVGDASQVNPETLAKTGIDAVWHGGSSHVNPEESQRLHRLGIASIIGGEWMEPHPLGRAEWLLFYGALLGRLPEAQRRFSDIETAYLRRRDSLQTARPAPTAFCGAPWQGIWHVPGGRSYPAQLARDAGLHYLWDDDSTEGSLALSPEKVLARARDAELWLNPGSFATLDQALRADSRYRHLAAFRNGRVFAPDARSHADGGNDYWESGVTHPDELLRDLARLARGDTSELRYWRQLR